MHLALDDRRPAHLTEVHAALTSLPEPTRNAWASPKTGKTGPHQLTYRQVEHTHRLITRALARPEPDGAPSPGLQHVCDQLTEASIPDRIQERQHLDGRRLDRRRGLGPASPARGRPGTGTDPEARWGHRNVNRRIQEGEMFFGYYLSAAVMVADENGRARARARPPDHRLPSPPRPRRRTGRRAHLDASQRHRARRHHRRLRLLPPRPRHLGHPAARCRRHLVQDLHPHDRGPRGTHHGAIIANGSCTVPPPPGHYWNWCPLPPGAPAADTAVHDQQTAELARYKLGVHAAEDADGYRRHACPAAAGKIRCPLRPASMKLDRTRPEILTPPQHPPACCTQQTITAGPEVAAKTRQKHDYPSAAWRISYRRRTAAERLNAAIKDPAVNSIDRGWIRLTGLTPLMLWLACLMVVRNQRTLAAFQARQQHDARAAASGQQPRARKRRRELAGAPAGPP